MLLIHYIRRLDHDQINLLDLLGQSFTNVVFQIHWQVSYIDQGVQAETFTYDISWQEWDLQKV